MKPDLDNLLEFVKFTHQIRNIERAILLESDARRENDMEHGYQLALVAWFLLDSDNLKLDKFRVTGMALAHDAIEVYSGDTSAHASASERAAHEARSKMAVREIKKHWPGFTSMHSLVDEYQELKTPESKFVYALDKLMPVINIYLFEGRSWKQQSIDFKEMKRVKIGKIEKSPEVNKYYRQLLRLLEQNPEMFGKRKK